MSKKLALILMLLFVPYALCAATGKFAGKVIDRETGDPLPGANVFIVGTTLGAATDVDGEYFILNVSPGTYELLASFIGYSTLRIKNIRAVAGLTVEVNFELVPEAIQAGEIVIVAERHFFEKKCYQYDSCCRF